MNEVRVELIEALRKGLGEQFVGGLEVNGLARERYETYIYRGDTRKHRSLATMQANLVGVATPGLHGSTGWKLPEYIAASRCVVSQVPPHRLPRPLETDRHILPFATPAECVDACQRLLDDETLAIEMRRANESYYKQTLAPDVMIKTHLDTAMSRCR